MLGLPCAKREGLRFVEVAGAFIVQDTAGQEMARFDRITEAVWRLADGRTPVEKIAHKLTSEFDIAADNEVVWAALDQLSDSELMTERTTPPAAANASYRRGILSLAVVFPEDPIRGAADPVFANQESERLDKQTKDMQEKLQKQQAEQTEKQFQEKRNKDSGREPKPPPR
jgi:hypothetical protein